ncbi:MAG: DUF4493 domain-containing protein [Bacteroidales bacterium]|nr:DUF4493 domain-containing protein [Bacteroidales bacterium]
MKRILTMMVAAVVFSAVSCTKSEMKDNVSGMGMLSVDMSLPELATRAISDEHLINTAVVNIYKADFSGLVRSYRYSDIPSEIYLAADSYRVDVIAGETVSESPAAASWENRSYKGSDEFDIVAGQVTSVTVAADVNNAVTAISFDQTVAENFVAGYTFTIGLDSDESAKLIYDESKSGAEGYFIVAGLDEPSFNWTFTGTLAKDGSEFTKSGTISNVLPGKLYRMNIRYTIKDGDLEFTLSVDRVTEIIDDVIIFEPVSTGLTPSPAYEIWAGHATLHADVDAGEYAGATVRFGYTSDGQTWAYADAVSAGDGAWTADIKGLAPSTEYTYTLLINDEQVGDALNFTTDAAPNLPNASFEYASLVTGASYYKFYDPACGVEEGASMFWGSGNGEGPDGVNGSANMGIEITYVDKDVKVHGKQSVRAQTSEMAGFLAAGNLFTGQFDGLVGTEGGKVNFGRPWQSRPTALKVWCRYETDKIDVINSMPPGITLTKNDYDRAQIKVAIGTWNYKTYGGTKNSPVHVNTTDESTFVDYYTDSSTIANGDIIIYNDGYQINKGNKVSATTTEWVEYTIPLDYHDLKSYPTHIIVSCASSQYGDYFTGNNGSKLWLDAFELVYE